ncbi:conjugal transfer protein [Amycolatopsis aidingensis]|uniref:conjugal transfer protein n=1 Tax=Amycolatopsis aidingensis TaxID=2842453 RepID=UPI001C0B5388|nr:conjugal transfer protein [Amycolatopsis aidingensis]
MTRRGSPVPDAPVESLVRSVTRRGGTVLAWTVVLASPLVTLAALLLLRPTDAGAPSTQAAEQGYEAPGGWAEMYVRAWLSASREDAAGVEAFYPAGVRSTRARGTQVPVDTVTVSATAPSPGVWSVVVAVNVLTRQPDSHHVAAVSCVQVSLLEQHPADEVRRAYVAAALPALVACPATLPAAELAYPESAEVGGPIGQSVAGFLAAYVAGQGAVDRFVAPGAPLAAVTPAPYRAVRVEEVRTHETFEPGQAARPPDGTETRVLARAWGRDAAGEDTPLDYALTLRARAGRWEVRQIDPAPLSAAPPAPPPEPTQPPPATGPPAATSGRR